MSILSELKPYQVITDGSMAGDITSLVTLIPKISLVTYTYRWSGTSPVGVVRVQISNEYDLDSQGNVRVAGTDWSSVSFVNHGSTTPVASIAISGNTGADNVTLTLTGGYALRTIYQRTSGTGTLQAFICGKVS